MEITGKIIRVFDPISGESKSTGKPWRKREYVMEVQNGQYPRQVYFNFFGDRADQFILEGGKDYTISFDIESREWNGRWFTDIRAYNAVPANAPVGGQQGSYQQGSSFPQPPTPPAFNDPLGGPMPKADNQDFIEASNDDLPF